MEAYDAGRLVFVEDCDLDYEVAACAMQEYRPPVELRRCCDAREVAEVAESFSPRLYVVDLRLGHDDGVDVIAMIRARENTRSCSIVLFTSSDDPAQSARALQAGADDVRIKPITTDLYMAEFQNLVSTWLFRNDLN